MAEPRRGTKVRSTLLLCGIASSLLYAATDLLGGTRYPGYSFSAQMVSELMAVGAPSESFVDPLFLTYDLLVLAFGLGLVREAGRDRALRATGGLLVGYAVIGLTGPTLFEMHPRGTVGANDIPHIAVTAVLVVLELLAMGCAALALGGTFRRYTIATVVVTLGVGALTAPAGMRLAAGEPTPGFGILERITIYALMLWVAALAVVLLRRPAAAATAG
jgi:hypothetical protein